MLLACAWCADIFAFLVGSALKGPKLWPRFSPNKTWSGFVGGLIAAALAGLLVVFLAKGDADPSLRWAAPIGLLAGLATMAGDLWESMLKRRFGVKDSGGLIPGHGGLLDRVDGLMFASIAMAGARLVAFATPVIVSASILDALGHGAYNFHPGPPEYRGWYPHCFAAYERAATFGATAHVMTKHIDAGPIVALERFPVSPGGDAAALGERAYGSMLKLFAELTPAPQPQPAGGVAEPQPAPYVPPTPAKPQYIKAQSITVPFAKTYLEDEDDVTRYLDEMKKTLLAEIGAGKKVIV